MVFVSETLCEHNLDILCILETWMYQSDTDVILSQIPETYNILHVPRHHNGVSGRGGGVAVIYSKAINFNTVSPSFDRSSFEVITISASIQCKPLKIAIIYRPGHPGTDTAFMSEFGDYLEWFLNFTGSAILCGDFNYWIDDLASKPYSQEFHELLSVNNCINHICGPTHISGHTLDLVITPKMVLSPTNFCTHPIDPNISDHALLTFQLNLPTSSSTVKNITFRNYKNLDLDLVRDGINNTLNTTDLLNGDSHHLVSVYNKMFTDITSEFCPLVNKTIRVRDDAPWYDESVAALRRVRRKAERRWRRLRCEDSRACYILARRAVVNRVSQRKLEYYKSRIDECNGDQTLLWRVLNELRGCKSLKPLPSNLDQQALVNEFAQFFSSKISGIRLTLDSTPLHGDLSVDFNYGFALDDAIFSVFQPVSDGDILRIIRSLKKKKSYLDPIDYTKIADVYEAAVPLISAIVNRCFTEGTFPESEKRAAICPILKSPTLDKEILNNYRPISNLSFLSKILEKSILDQFRPYLETYGVIPINQSAYRSNCSTETALCRIYNDMVAYSCLGTSSILLLFDLSAAFDTIDQPMLLDDLKNLGFRDSALSLFHNYLTCRSQFVYVNEKTSDSFDLNYGVPQGSVLGPTLFIVYMAGLARLLDMHHVNYHFYADDTQIYLPIYDVDETKGTISSLLNDMKLWMLKRKLKLNDNKTELVIIRGNQRHDITPEFSPFEVGEHEIQPALSVRDIGVHIDANLSFNQHIKKTVTKCNFHIRNLYSIKKNMTAETLKTIVHALITTSVDYCNILFLGLPNQTLKKLQSILNRAARLISGLPPGHPTTAALIELHWLPIKARIEFKACLMTYKILKSEKPQYLYDLLKPRTLNTDVVLRSVGDPYILFEPRAINGRAFGERSFSFCAPRLYNRLPIEIKKSSSVDVFKSKLKTHLFAKCYNIAEKVVHPDYKL